MKSVTLAHGKGICHKNMLKEYFKNMPKEYSNNMSKEYSNNIPKGGKLHTPLQ